MWHKTSCPKEPTSYGGKPARQSVCLGHGSKNPQDHSFYALYRYWYKRTFFAWQTLDALVFSEASGAKTDRPKFGISVCFQLF
jgi:hypothetical protein